MTNNQIKYIIEVANTGSVNQAARNLFLSQSAISNAITSVEEEFGHKIFNRSSRGVTLTSFGKLFIAYITPINRQLNQLYAMRGLSTGSDQPSLTVISNGFYYLSDVMAALGRRYRSTGLRLSLLEDYGGNMLESISNRTADLGVVRLWSCYRDNNLEQYSAMKLLYHPICELQVGVDVSPASPLYHYAGASITPELLANLPQIMHESLDCGPYADILQRLKLPSGKLRYVVDSRAALYELLDTTDGYVLNSRKVLEDGTCRTDMQGHDLRFIPLADCPIRSEIGWLTKENTALNQVGRDFVHMLKNYLSLDITPNY